jgi:hypothetical protein
MRMADAIAAGDAALSKWRSDLGISTGSEEAAKAHVLPYFDVIIVRGPPAFDPNHPGRMQSIVTAMTLAGPGTHLFISDCDRDVELKWITEHIPLARGSHAGDSLEVLLHNAIRQRKAAGAEDDDLAKELIPAALAPFPYWTSEAVKRYLGAQAFLPTVKRREMHSAHTAQRAAGHDKDPANHSVKWVFVERNDAKLCHYRRWDEDETWPGEDATAVA